MKTIHHNGEYWYTDVRPLWKRIAMWLCYPMGWSTWRKLGRDPFYMRGQSRLGVFLHLITPVSFFGHRFTIFGNWLHVSAGSRWLVIGAPQVFNADDPVHRHVIPGKAYLSCDGTPSKATTWLWGAPYDVAQQAREHTRR